MFASARLRSFSFRTWAGILGLLAAPTIGWASEPWKGPDHLGKARLGMSLSELRTRYPNLQVIQPPGAASGPEDIATTLAEVENERIESLGRCSLRFQLLNDKLYQVQARCDRKAEELEAHLRKAYGPPHFTREEPLTWYWRSSASTLIYSREQRQISLADNSWAGALFYRALRAPAAPTPAATP